jgi:hypothetical protein
MAGIFCCQLRKEQGLADEFGALLGSVRTILGFVLPKRISAGAQWKRSISLK